MNTSRLKALATINHRKFSQKEYTTIKKASEIYGSLTFGVKEMRERLSKNVLEALEHCKNGKHALDEKTAESVAEAVKNWAVAQGVTHFTHWFQPLTGLTAEKHDSFITFDGEGSVIEKFSWRQLLQSEPDASSFPSGGMRSTFEARGYTAWDPSSPIFILEHAGAKVLCVPSVFVSYTGHSLDTKTGLIRSLNAVNDSALALLHEMGDTKISHVNVTLGCEQEYFLIDRDFVVLRPDLLLCGRTLVGGESSKGQQLEDHYFGSIPTRVQAFMVDVEKELYRLGIPVKTRHNEVAPSQFETAPIFEDANLASDHNMLTMEVLKRIAEEHGLVCLLHEKPFAGINGSGKHNNWAMATDTGINLLEPGSTPHSNFRFLAFLASTLRAVNLRQVALRAAIASHGNDHRLGANEAPPAIISVFLGETLTEIVEAIAGGRDLSKYSAEKAMIEFGMNRLPKLPKDNTDRNRTSPFAFTGNKFEFRAVGSSQSVAFPITVLNAAVAESLKEFTKRLKSKRAQASSVESAVLDVAKEFFIETKNIRFEGDGYSEEWRKEAKKRGLKEILTTPDALKAFEEKNEHQFLIEQGVYKEDEFKSRTAIAYERYIKNLKIEADTLETLIRQYVLPAAHAFEKTLGGALSEMKAAGLSESAFRRQKDALDDFASLTDKTYHVLSELRVQIDAAHKVNAKEGTEEAVAKYFSDKVVAVMKELRELADKIESQVADNLWPLPKYREMLFIR